MNLFVILSIILAQIATATPTPSPVATGTPVPTVTPIPYIEETPNAPMMPDNVVIDGDQIYFSGRPVLPAESGGLLFSYAKWLIGPGSSSAFGPFAPLIIHVGAILTIFLMLLAIWIVQQIFSLSVRVFLWAIRFVRGGG